MNQNRLHNQSSFFKYTSASTAKIILKNQSLRWSHPSILNDPFDFPKEIWREVSPSGVADILAHSLGLGGSSQCSVSQSINEIREIWRQDIYPDSRIISFSERWDSASMWDRYSDSHKGVVLQFACVDELDSAWLQARQVVYSDSELHANTTEGVADLMLRFSGRDLAEQMLLEFTHTKTTDWLYEKEWRVASWKRPLETGDFSDYGFHENELTGIIFGASASDEDREELLSLIEDRYPQARIQKSSVAEGRRIVLHECANREQKD